MKRLLLLRHAKSDWDSGAATDHERPLNRRGREAARTMGLVIARIGEIPDVAVTSSAVRARRTVELAADAGEWATEIVVERHLYGTSPDGALAVIRRLGDDAERLMVVGHQPAWGALVHAVTGASVQMKTATIAVIDVVEGASPHRTAMSGELVALLQPRHFEDTGWAVDEVT